MYSTVNKRFAGGETGVEVKKRYGRIQHAPYSLDLAPFDLRSFPD